MIKNFRFQVILRTVLLALTIGILPLVYSQESPTLIFTLLGIAVLILAQVVLLIRYVESMTRQLTRFFDSIHNADFSQTFKPPANNTAQSELSKRMSEVMEAFRRTRSANEEHLRYVDRVVQHVGVGLISFDPDGNVELINNAAKRLLNISGLRNIHSLGTISEPLVRTMSAMKPGERGLVQTAVEGRSMQLSLHAMAFRMRSGLYTLISLQDIQGELDRERMSKELDIAKELQQRLLPKDGLENDSYEVAGICAPAEEVGGDYYDYVKLQNGNSGIFIADVSGKGVPAAIYMTLAKGIAQACATQFTSPKDVLSHVNELIYGTIELGSFVTMTYMVLARGGEPSIVARAGHTPPIHYSHSEKTANVIESQGMALGFRNGADFSGPLTEQEIEMQPGDIILLYTDGATEALNEDNEEFGMDRLQRSVIKHADRSAHGLIDAIRRDVEEFANQRTKHDDMTLVVVKKKSQPAMEPVQ